MLGDRESQLRVLVASSLSCAWLVMHENKVALCFPDI